MIGHILWSKWRGGEQQMSKSICPSKSSVPAPTQSGFTLMEIMLVVVILLIATGIAVPMLRGTSEAAQLRNVVRSTVRLSRYARSMAILNQFDCTLTFATNHIMLATSAEKTLVERHIPAAVELIDFTNLAEKRTSSETQKTVLYNSSGMNDGFELTWADRSGRQCTVRCNPITGKTEVDDRH